MLNSQKKNKPKKPTNKTQQQTKPETKKPWSSNLFFFLFAAEIV